MCVCSDDTVKEEQDDFVTFSADLGIKVDTDPRVIRNFLRKKTNKLKIVFTTYQSGRATAIGSKGFNYDLGIMDEASMLILPQAAYAASLSKEKVVLAGDFMQLPPIITTDDKHSNYDVVEKYLGHALGFGNLGL